MLEGSWYSRSYSLRINLTKIFTAKSFDEANKLFPDVISKNSQAISMQPVPRDSFVRITVTDPEEYILW